MLSGINNSKSTFFEKHHFVLLMISGILIGAVLRVYRIDSQIIWDDEWHGIQTAIYHPLQYILTHFHELDNCIPLTAYYRIMLQSFGLSEMIIRLPQLLSGILMLLLFPLIVKKLLNKNVAVIFLFMLAISPLLIYFSRFARPYGIVVFLSFISVSSFYLWLNERKLIYALMYVVTAVLAPYFSLSVFAFVTAPVFYIIILSLFKNRFSFARVLKSIPGAKHISVFVLVLISGISVWLLPAAGSLGEVTKKNAQGFLSLGTVGGGVSLFSGSSSYVLFLFLIALFIYGAYILYGSDTSLFCYLFAVCLLQLVFIVVTRPNLVQGSIIFTRYIISALPIWLLVVSIAINELRGRVGVLLQKKTEKTNALVNLLVAGLFLVIFLNGPVVDAYSFPNDFTNHKDFQYKYLDRLIHMADGNEGSYPAFYKNLKNQVGDSEIIEFPAIISWTWNIFHVYQRVHNRRVIIGYDSDYYGPFFGYDTFGRMDVGFHNFVDISDPQRLSDNEAEYIVLHKDIWKESVAAGLYSPDNRRNMEKRLSLLPVQTRDELQQYVFRTIANMDKKFNSPFYEDKWIVVYKMK